mmetsp:Transcript_3887/g.6848  ORF Transcript_3887/g.6848 Transcript_3887/m.6848 type:complete len:128 (+) Transcript_3887:523-906(+)
MEYDGLFRKRGLVYVNVAAFEVNETPSFETSNVTGPATLVLGAAQRMWFVSMNWAACVYVLFQRQDNDTTFEKPEPETFTIVPPDEDPETGPMLVTSAIPWYVKLTPCERKILSLSRWILIHAVPDP